MSLNHRSKSNFDSMKTLKDLLEFAPMVNFLRNDNSSCCCTKETNIESAHHERRIYGSRPAGRERTVYRSWEKCVCRGETTRRLFQYACSLPPAHHCRRAKREGVMVGGLSIRAATVNRFTGYNRFPFEPVHRTGSSCRKPVFWS